MRLGESINSPTVRLRGGSATWCMGTSRSVQALAAFMSCEPPSQSGQPPIARKPMPDLHTPKFEHVSRIKVEHGLEDDSMLTKINARCSALTDQGTWRSVPS